MPTQRPFTNWLEAWTRLYARTQLPQKFVFWSGIWVISSTLQDNVVLREGQSVLKPNLYIWLIGPSGTGKSETAMPAVNFVRKVPFIELYDGQLTALYLYKFMRNVQQKQAISRPNVVNPRVSIYSDELAATLGSPQMAEELMRALTVMYASSYKYGTGAHDLFDVENPVINWLACCAPPWLRMSIPRAMLESGFVGRIISVYEPLGSRRTGGVSDDPTLLGNILTDLLRIASLSGEFTLTPEAQHARDAWADKQWEAQKLTDDITQALCVRNEEHALKVAMCLSAANSSDLTITERGFVNATKWVLAARESSLDVLRSLAYSPNVEQKMMLLRYIQKHAPVLHSIVRAALYRRIEDNNQFHRFANSLIAEGQIVAVPSPNGQGTMYDLPNNVTQNGGTQP